MCDILLHATSSSIGSILISEHVEPKEKEHMLKTKQCTCQLETQNLFHVGSLHILTWLSEEFLNAWLYDL